MKKFEGYGILGNISRWITEWLGDKKQQIQLNRHRLDGWRLEEWCMKGVNGLGL